MINVWYVMGRIEVCLLVTVRLGISDWTLIWNVSNAMISVKNVLVPLIIAMYVGLGLIEN